MYIVKRGRLQVVVDEDIGDGKGRVIRNLHEGAVFGELRQEATAFLSYLLEITEFYNTTLKSKNPSTIQSVKHSGEQTKQP